MALTSATVEAAIEAILDGAQSYNMDGRAVTKANLAELRALRKELKEEEAQATGSIFTSPRFGAPRRS